MKRETSRIPTDVDAVTLSLGRREVRLTNLRKPFWPKVGLTKGDLLRWYEAIGPTLLPHVRRRPMVLRRYPDGASGEAFFMKRVPPGAPEWLARCGVPKSEGGVTLYPVVDDLASLLWIANLGCIDMNPWHGRCDALEKPDYLNFDLDPGPRASFRHVREGALLIGELLTRLHVPASVKTSGMSGMHIFVPIVRGASQRDVLKFAQALSEALGARFPKLFTTVVSTARRPPDRVLIDCNQNRPGSTLASVYSARPSDTAAVSTPLAWDEVGKVEPGQFNFATVLERVEERGDLFAPPTGGERIELKALLDLAKPYARRTGGRSPEDLLRRLGPAAPALAAEADAIDESWLFEIKYDGVRALAALVGGRVALRSRNGLDLMDRAPEVARALARLDARELTVDGELLGDERPRFVAFDLLWLDGKDWRQRPIESRRRRLEALFAEAPAPLELAERIEGPVERALDAARARGLEGVVAKRRRSRYGGRWLKLKLHQSDEFAIVGYTPLKNGMPGVGALLLARPDHGRLYYAGKVGTGFKQRERESLEQALSKLRIGKPPLRDTPRLAGARWIEPRVVAEIGFAERTAEGRLLHPVFRRLRPDKA